MGLVSRQWGSVGATPVAVSGRILRPCPHRAGCRVRGWTSASPRGARLTHASRGLHPAAHPARVFHDARSSRRWK